MQRHREGAALIPGTPDEVFAFVDDHSRFASHMSESSWMMGRSRMLIEVDGAARMIAYHSQDAASSPLRFRTVTRPCVHALSRSPGLRRTSARPRGRPPAELRVVETRLHEWEFRPDHYDHRRAKQTGDSSRFGFVHGGLAGAPRFPRPRGFRQEPARPLDVTNAGQSSPHTSPRTPARVPRQPRQARGDNGRRTCP